MTIFIGITAMILFVMGVAGFLIRRNPLVMFMSIELMLNAVNLGLVMIGRVLQNIDAQIIAFFIIIVAAAEVAVGLGILVTFFAYKDDVDVDSVDLMKG